MPPELTPLQIARFWSHVPGRENATACWLWNGRETSRRVFPVNGQAYGCGRIALYLVRGEWSETLFVLHTCDVESCVNPAHLYLGTQRENMLDRSRRGRTNLTSLHPELLPTRPGVDRLPKEAYDGSEEGARC